MQLAGFVVGIILVRFLDKTDYAYYAVFTSVLAAVVALSDGGVTSVLMSEGARAKARGESLLGTLRLGLKHRRVLALLASIGGSAFVAWLLLLNAATTEYALFAAGIMFLTVWPTIDKSVYQVPLRLDGRYAIIQVAALVGAMSRAALILVALALDLFDPWTVLLITLAGALTEFLFARRAFMRGLTTRTADVDADLPRKFRDTIRRVLPASVTGVLQGQVYILTLSLLSTSDIIAELSALARYTVIYVLLSSFFLDVVSSHLARRSESSSALRAFFVRTLGAFLGCVALVAVGVSLASPILLSILGPGYTDLQIPLTIVTAGSGLIAFGNAWKNLNHSRNWVSGSWVLIPCTGVWLAVGLFLLDLTNPVEASIWMASQAFAPIVAQLVSTIIGFRTTDRGRHA